MYKNNMQPKKSIDVGWGHTPLLFELLQKHMGPISVQITASDYLPYGGMQELKNIFVHWAHRHLLLDLSDYSLIITEGASRAIQLAGLIAQQYTALTYMPTHYYTKAPFLLQSGSLKIQHLPITEMHQISSESWLFLEGPSNPLGQYFFPKKPLNFILDLAYHSPGYVSGRDLQKASKKIATLPITPQMLIFSLGKLTGLNNLRIGILAVKSKEMYDYGISLQEHSTLGPSHAAQKIAINLLSKRPSQWQAFFSDVYYRLRQRENSLDAIMRATFKRHVKKQNMPRGMFAVYNVSEHVMQGLRAQQIIVFSGEKSGLAPSSIRLNLAQSTPTIRELFMRIASIK